MVRVRFALVEVNNCIICRQVLSQHTFYYLVEQMYCKWLKCFEKSTKITVKSLTVNIRNANTPKCVYSTDNKTSILSELLKTVPSCSEADGSRLLEKNFFQVRCHFCQPRGMLKKQKELEDARKTAHLCQVK